jgi:hypothetical protein
VVVSWVVAREFETTDDQASDECAKTHANRKIKANRIIGEQQTRKTLSESDGKATTTQQESRYGRPWSMVAITDDASKIARSFIGEARITRTLCHQCLFQ